VPRCSRATLAAKLGLLQYPASRPEAQLPECLDQIGMILLPEEQMIDAIVTIRAALRGLGGPPNELGLATQSARQDRDQRRRRGGLMT
jgi:hypothetical protein